MVSKNGSKWIQIGSKWIQIGSTVRTSIRKPTKNNSKYLRITLKSGDFGWFRDRSRSDGFFQRENEFPILVRFPSKSIKIASTEPKWTKIVQFSDFKRKIPILKRKFRFFEKIPILKRKFRFERGNSDFKEEIAIWKGKNPSLKGKFRF